MTEGQLLLMGVASEILASRERMGRGSGGVRPLGQPPDRVVRPPKPFREMTGVEYLLYLERGLG